MSDQLRNYIRKRLKESGLSARAAATAMGASHAHFARVLTGQSRPGPELCNKLADLFGDPPAKIFRLAGWLPDEGDSALGEELRELAARDPSFRTLVNVYQELSSPSRDLLVKIAKVLAEHAERGQEQ